MMVLLLSWSPVPTLSPPGSTCDGVGSTGGGGGGGTATDNTAVCESLNVCFGWLAALQRVPAQTLNEYFLWLRLTYRY